MFSINRLKINKPKTKLTEFYLYYQALTKYHPNSHQYKIVLQELSLSNHEMIKTQRYSLILRLTTPTETGILCELVNTEHKISVVESETIIVIHDENVSLSNFVSQDDLLIK